MNNIVNVAQISLAVIQYSVAAALVGATTFSAWTTKKSKLLTVAAVIAVLGLNSQAFAKGQPTPFHLNSYYQQAMAVTTQAFAAGGSSGVGLSQVGGGFHSPVFAPPPVFNNPAPVFNPSEPYTVPETRETPVSPASPGSVFGNG